jgi:hypothetical protein
LKKLRLRAAELARTGVHPDLGIVSLGQLISKWAIRDFSHLSHQICHVLAKQRRRGLVKVSISILNR